MALVLRGKHKGEEVTIHQWANDWFTVVEIHGAFSPPSLHLTAVEAHRVWANRCGIDQRYIMVVEDNGKADYVARFRKRRGPDDRHEISGPWEWE